MIKAKNLVQVSSQLPMALFTKVITQMALSTLMASSQLSEAMSMKVNSLKTEDMAMESLPLRLAQFTRVSSEMIFLKEKANF